MRMVPQSSLHWALRMTNRLWFPLVSGACDGASAAQDHAKTRGSYDLARRILTSRNAQLYR